MDLSLSTTCQKWKRFALRLSSRLAWSRKGLLLWIIQRPEIRYLPLPLPSVASIQQWKDQMNEWLKLRAWPMKWAREAVSRMSLVNLKECVTLRGRLGMRVAFLENQQVLNAVMSLRQKPRHLIENALADERRRLQRLSEEDRKKKVEVLIGPRGGLPRLKGELQELCALMHIEFKAEDTVDQLKEKLKQPLTDLKNPKKAAAAKAAASSQAVGTGPSVPQEWYDLDDPQRQASYPDGDHRRHLAELMETEDDLQGMTDMGWMPEAPPSHPH